MRAALPVVVAVPLVLGLCPPTCPETRRVFVELEDDRGVVLGAGFVGARGDGSRTLYVEADLAGRPDGARILRVTRDADAVAGPLADVQLGRTYLGRDVPMAVSVDRGGAFRWTIPLGTFEIRLTFPEGYPLPSRPPRPAEPRPPGGTPPRRAPSEPAVGCGGHRRDPSRPPRRDPAHEGSGCGGSETLEDGPEDPPDDDYAGGCGGDPAGYGEPGYDDPVWDDPVYDDRPGESDHGSGCGGDPPGSGAEDEDAPDTEGCSDLEGDTSWEDERSAARALRFSFPFALVLGVNRRMRARSGFR